MLKFILLLSFIGITPLSASVYGEISYETDPDFYMEHDPTVCYISFDYSESYENVTKQAISNWQNGLQRYTNNYDAWNIYYKFIPINHYDDINDNADSLGCDIFVDFVDVLVDKDGNPTDELGAAGNLVSGHIVIEVATSFDSTDEQLVSTTTHELGHAFGLDHYITDDEELIEKWDKGIDIPSIMLKESVSENIKQITELDLEKVVSIYGADGFEELPLDIVDDASDYDQDKEIGFFEWLMNILGL